MRNQLYYLALKRIQIRTNILRCKHNKNNKTLRRLKYWRKQYAKVTKQYDNIVWKQMLDKSSLALYA